MNSLEQITVLVGDEHAVRARLAALVAAGRLHRDGLLAQGRRPDGRCFARVRLVDVKPRPRPARHWYNLADLESIQLVVVLLAFLATVVAVSVSAVTIAGMVTAAVAGMVTVALPAVMVVAIAALAFIFRKGKS